MSTLRVCRRSVVLLAALAAGRRAAANAGASQATPAASADTLLVEATFAADELPQGGAEGYFFRLTMPPGETLPYLAGPFCGCPGQQVAPGVGVELVESGTYAVRIEAPFRALRTGGGEEEVAAGEEMVLGPGDAAAFPDYAAPGEVRAAGNEPAVVVGIAVVAVADSGTPAPSLPLSVKGEQLSWLTEMAWADIATGGPVVMRLRRVELPVGAMLGPYETSGVEAMLVEAGRVESNTLRPGETSPAGKALVYQEGRTVPFLSLRPGNRRFVANAGDGPADLLVASIGPAAGAEARTSMVAASG